MEQKDITTLLHACCKIYEGEISILLPRHRLPLPLEDNTSEERMEELIYKCSDIFEAVVASDSKPVPTILTRRFISWFVKVFSTEFPSQLMRKALERVMKRQYHSNFARKS